MRPPPEPPPQKIKWLSRLSPPSQIRKQCFKLSPSWLLPHLHGWHPPALHRNLHPFPPLQWSLLCHQIQVYVAHHQSLHGWFVVWSISFCSIYALVFVCLLCDFVFYVCCIVFWILYSCLVCIKCVCQLSFGVCYNIRWAVLYEAAPNFISFAFFQLLLIRCDIVNKIETNYSRNARDEAKKMIRNWIERKTVDSHISYVNISRWTVLMHWLFEYGCRFKSLHFSANSMCNLHHYLVDYLSRIYSLKLLGNALSILTLALCNVMCFMEWSYVLLSKKII